VAEFFLKRLAEPANWSPYHPPSTADFVCTGHRKLFRQLKRNAVFTLLAPDPACLSRHHDEPAAP
jgi:hypothetical protein